MACIAGCERIERWRGRMLLETLLIISTECDHRRRYCGCLSTTSSIDNYSSSPPPPPRASVILSSCPLSSGLFSEQAPSTACATCAAGLHTEAHTDGAGQTRAVSHQIVCTCSLMAYKSASSSSCFIETLLGERARDTKMRTCRPQAPCGRILRRTC